MSVVLLKDQVMLVSDESLEEVPGSLQSQEDEANRKEGDVEGECSDGAHFVLDHVSILGTGCGQGKLSSCESGSHILLPRR